VKRAITFIVQFRHRADHPCSYFCRACSTDPHAPNFQQSVRQSLAGRLIDCSLKRDLHHDLIIVFDTQRRNMRSLCLAASLLSVASAVNIVAWRNDECAAYPGQPPVTTCRNIPSNFCCVFPDNIVGRIMSVYVGIFTLPGGVGNWHNEGSVSACGRIMDSDGDPTSVCLTDTGSNLYPGYGGGGTWLPIPPGDPSKSRTGSLIPAFAAPPGFANIRPASNGYGYKKRRSTSLEGRERERRDEKGAMSIEEWQVSD